MEKTCDSEFLKNLKPSTMYLRRMDLATQVAEARRNGTQELGFSSRPFSLCGIPYTKPQENQLTYERRNGRYVLSIEGKKPYGLPWGMDQAIPFWIATKLVKKFGSSRPLNPTLEDRVISFSNVNELLGDLGLQRNGWGYRKVEEMFQRVFHSTITWGSETPHKNQTTWKGLRFSFFEGLQITTFTNGENLTIFPELEEENMVLVGDLFFREVMTSALPFDMEIYRTLHNKPGMLHFFLTLSHRCHTAKGKSAIPLFGPEGMRAQLGVSDTLADKSVKLQIKRWLQDIKVYWPECPAYIKEDTLVVDQASFCTPRREPPQVR